MALQLVECDIPGPDGGIARWPRGAELPEPWLAVAPGDAQLVCELCERRCLALWPLFYYPPDPDFALADGEVLVCRTCAQAVRPP